MAHNSTFDRLNHGGIVPVVAIERIEQLLPLADALLEGGMQIIEITFRTAEAAKAIGILRKERPSLLVGAGTILNVADLEAAHAAGAAFGVSPGLNPRIVGRAREIGLPFIPGVATPSDIEASMEHGCMLMKFFPAEALGGVGMLDAISAPYRHTGLRFMPTGGITPGNLASYLGIDTVAAVGGTWLAKKEDLAQGRWGEVRARCQAALAVVASVRAV